MNLINRLLVFFLVVILALLWLMFLAVVRLLMLLEENLVGAAAPDDILIDRGVPAPPSAAELDKIQGLQNLENYYRDYLTKKR